MKIGLNLESLDHLVRMMEANESKWTPSDTALNPREQLRAELAAGGIEINLSDVTPGPARLLTYEGEQVLLYIKDTRKPEYTVLNEPEKISRFHVAECRKLSSMRDQGRIERYVVTNKTDGLFEVDWLDYDTGKRGTTEAGLKVCKLCLDEINWNGYSSKKPGRVRDAIWRQFEIDDFLFEFSTFFHSLPSRKADDVGFDDYPENWQKVSRSYREQCNWTCENCGVVLSERKSLLHCHHVNGVRGDSKTSNLRALCMICHSEQPSHTHMKVPAKKRQEIERIRFEQGTAAKKR